MADQNARDDALAALYRNSYPDLVRLAAFLLGSVAAAEDVTQEAFVRLASRYTGPDEYGVGYLRRTVVNLARSSWRRHRVARRAMPKLVAGLELVDDPNRSYFDRLAIVEALRCLPQRQKEVIVLRYYESMTEAETASLLGISIGSVKSTGARGLKNLKQRLQTTGLEPMDDARAIP